MATEGGALQDGRDVARARGFPRSSSLRAMASLSSLCVRRLAACLGAGLDCDLELLPEHLALALLEELQRLGPSAARQGLELFVRHRPPSELELTAVERLPEVRALRHLTLSRSGDGMPWKTIGFNGFSMDVHRFCSSFSPFLDDFH